MMKKKYMALVALCIGALMLCLILALSKGLVAGTEYYTPDTGDIDVSRLQEENPHIMGWLEIPGTSISYPLLQHPRNDEYYLNHNTEDKISREGSLFTEHLYNGRNFTDSVTVIYGNAMESGAMFGTLQTIYSDSDSFKEHNRINIYLPDKMLTYTVFAAVPYDSRHILYTYDFDSGTVYGKFFGSIRAIRALDANFDDEINMTEPNRRVIILSTCYKGDNSKRYLVMALCDEYI